MLRPSVHREPCCLASLPCPLTCRPSFRVRRNRRCRPDELAARVASGPGFWTEWLAELDRQGLLEDLLAEDVIARALREAPTGHRYDRVLTAKMTVVCVLVACLFPGDGYDAVLARAFGLPGLRFRPGTEVPAGSAFSQARKLLGEQAMRRIFELDAERADADLGITALWKGLEVTALDGTTMELARNDALACEFGTPAEARQAAAADRRARPHRHPPVDRRRDRQLPRRGERPGRQAGMVVQAGHAQPRRPRLLLHGPVPAVLRRRRGPGLARQERREIRPRSRPSGVLPDGSELVMLHESDGMRTRRRRETGNPARRGSRTPSPGSSPSPSRTETRSGRAKTTQIRVLTTLLDHEAFPAREIAALYAERWQVETAFLHLKKTVRGPRRPLRGQSPGPRPAGSLGAPAHPQHRRHRRRPRRRRGRDRSPAHPVHRRPRRSSARTSPPTSAAGTADTAPPAETTRSAP